MQAIPAVSVVGPDPITITCPNCHTYITTVVTKETGAKAWISCGVLLLFGCWLGCCLIPFCIDSLNYRVHHCPRCGAFIGRYNG